jgi:hypothetical protein
MLLLRIQPEAERSFSQLLAKWPWGAQHTTPLAVVGRPGHSGSNEPSDPWHLWSVKRDKDSASSELLVVLFSNTYRSHCQLVTSQVILPQRYNSYIFIISAEYITYRYTLPHYCTSITKEAIFLPCCLKRPCLRVTRLLSPETPQFTRSCFHIWELRPNLQQRAGAPATPELARSCLKSESCD